MFKDLIPRLHPHRRAAVMNARARRSGAIEEIHAVMLVELFLKSGGVCAWCGSLLRDVDDVEFDHVRPFRLQGANSRENLVVSCADCNRRKAEKHPARFAQEQTARGVTTPLIRLLLAEYELNLTAQGRLFEDDDDFGPM